MFVITINLIDNQSMQERLGFHELNAKQKHYIVQSVFELADDHFRAYTQEAILMSVAIHVLNKVAAFKECADMKAVCDERVQTVSLEPH